MRVCIHTHYSGFNYGAFLQALGTQYFISSLENDLSLSFHYSPPLSLKSRLLEYRLRLLSPSSLSFSCNLGIINTFRSFQKTFLPSNTNNSYSKSPQLNIYGADEILNVRSPFFSNSFIPSPSQFSTSFYFSASVGSACGEDFSIYQADCLKSLASMNRITVRDQYSQDTIHSITDSRPPITCDPAYYLPLNNIANLYSFSAIKTINSPFILLYAHHLGHDVLDQISKLAKEENLQVISYPYRNNISSLRVDSFTPFELLALFKNARYIFTNMFHGVVLSTVLNPRFAFIPNDLRSKKLSFMKEHYSLNSKYWVDADTSPTKYLHSDISFKSIESHIAYSRKIHSSFISHNS